MERMPISGAMCSEDAEFFHNTVSLKRKYTASFMSDQIEVVVKYNGTAVQWKFLVSMLAVMFVFVQSFINSC
jgi:hypothetical protein